MLRRRDVAMDGLAQVVHHAQSQNAGEIQVRQALFEHHRHQAQAPGVFGRAFLASARAAGAAQDVFQLFGLSQEFEPALQGVGVHESGCRKSVLNTLAGIATNECIL